MLAARDAQKTESTRNCGAALTSADFESGCFAAEAYDRTGGCGENCFKIHYVYVCVGGSVMMFRGQRIMRCRRTGEGDKVSI